MSEDQSAMPTGAPTPAAPAEPAQAEGGIGAEQGTGADPAGTEEHTA